MVFMIVITDVCNDNYFQVVITYMWSRLELKSAIFMIIFYLKMQIKKKNYTDEVPKFCTMFLGCDTSLFIISLYKFVGFFSIKVNFIIYLFTMDAVI